MTIRYKPTLEWFKGKMDEKLSENTDKSHWRDEQASWLYCALMTEIGEYVRAWTLHDHEEMIREAADIANFAMMLADKSRIVLQGNRTEPKP